MSTINITMFTFYRLSSSRMTKCIRMYDMYLIYYVTSKGCSVTSYHTFVSDFENKSWFIQESSNLIGRLVDRLFFIILLGAAVIHFIWKVIGSVKMFMCNQVVIWYDISKTIWNFQWNQILYQVNMIIMGYVQFILDSWCKMKRK